MATRTFCDHCGNTVRSPHQFQFGPKPVRDTSSEELQYALRMARIGGFGDGAGSAGIKQAMAGIGKPAPVPAHPTTTIDLCDVCIPIWLKRVSALCKASDPEEKDV